MQSFVKMWYNYLMEVPMTIVKHNPYKDKFPLGAVKNNQKLKIDLYIENSKNPQNCQLRLNFDGDYDFSSYDMSLEKKLDEFLKFSATITIPKEGIYHYFFSFTTMEETLYVGKGDKGAIIGSFLPQWQITVYKEEFVTPNWIKGGIIYQIFPDRFNKADISVNAAKQPRKIVDNWYSTPDFIYENPQYKADDFFMGNLQGIIQKLPYLKELNVSAIYLNPIFESAENHRYSTADYMKIDPYLGNEETFCKLAFECDKLGIKLILDGVFSHTGADSIYFNKYNHYDSIGAYNSPNSPYYSWYKFKDYPNSYESWWNFENLPNVNEDNQNYLDFITNKQNGVLANWLYKGAYGYRLDVIDEIPDIFLDKLRETVKSINPEYIIIGEVWEDATTKEAYGKRRRYLLGDQMDSVMNYPWKRAIIQVIKTKNTEEFYESIMTIIANYPNETLHCLMNILSSHDTLRIITALGENRNIPPEHHGSTFLTDEMKDKVLDLLKTAVFLQFSLPGIPSIYYGDEVGLEGFKDPYCRRGYPWGRENTQILEFYKTMGNLRANNQEAYKADLEFVHWKDGVIIYKRANLYFLINLNEQSTFIDILMIGKPIFSQGRLSLTPLGLILEQKSLHILKTNKE